MENTKRRRGRPPKCKVMEFAGMTYEGAINNALDQEVKTDLDKSLADKDECQFTDDERKYLKRKKEKKVLHAQRPFHRIGNAGYSFQV